MGASSSRSGRLHRSSPDDVVANLVSSLDDVMAWEDLAPQIKQATMEPARGEGEEAGGSISCSMTDEVCLALSEMERVLDKKKAGKKGSGGGESGVFYTGIPFQQLAQQQPQGQGKGAEADEELKRAKAQQAQRAALMAQILPKLYPSSELCKAVAVAKVVDRVEGEGGKEEVKGGEGATDAGTGERRVGAVELEPDEQEKRMEVLAKFLFVYAVLTKTQRGAEHCYKLKSKMDHYAKLLKPKRLNELTEMQKLRLRRQHEETQRALNQALLHVHQQAPSALSPSSPWDKTGSAANWLKRDFELSYSAFRCHRLLDRLIHTREEIKQRLVMQPSAEFQKQQQILDQWIFQLELSAHELELARQQSEREALSVGLNFFDLDQKGSISPSECPELSARLFAMLDVNHHGLISHSDLQQAIDGMMEEMDHKLDHIKALDRDIDELRRRQAAGHTTDLIAVQVAQNEATLEELRKEVDERKRVLQSIFHYFHTAFALHVFGVTGRDLQYRPVDIRSLVKELERVEKEANEDPLQVDEKATVFRREEHARRLARSVQPDMPGGGRPWELPRGAGEEQTAASGAQRAVEHWHEAARYSQRAPELGGPTWSGMATQEHAQQATAEKSGAGLFTAAEVEKEQVGAESVTKNMKEWTELGQSEPEQGGGLGEKLQEVMAGAKEKVEQVWTKAKEATTHISPR